ncbi:hypothetical protein M0646_00265 [Thermosynechococcus sp. B3]|nr:hypothetical protein [Thermosynechococcus sp. B3]WJI29193.1 hypothetical protein M0646_00265 [Thermosynechococcus sp. B3]
MPNWFRSAYAASFPRPAVDDFAGDRYCGCAVPVECDDWLYPQWRSPP